MRVLVGITGGIASYKSCELIRLLKKANHEVTVCLTDSAREFITPLTLETLSKNKVLGNNHLDSNSEINHVKASRAVDLIVVAPATANFIAKLTHGICDDLLTNICAARKAKLFIAPAMNIEMWKNPSNLRNIDLLINDGISIIGPEKGIQACGDDGIGRMESPTNIYTKIMESIRKQNTYFSKKKIIVSAGPTIEKIDPVRAITNFSTGRMGYTLAKHFAEEGADVTLVSGPVNLLKPENTRLIKVESAVEMHLEILNICKAVKYDYFVSTAAVADWRPSNINSSKMKKKESSMAEIDWVLNPDIVKEIGNLPKNIKPFIVGFAAETSNPTQILKLLKDKRKEKKMDLLIANKVPESFGDNFSEVFMICKHDSIKKIVGNKETISREILNHLKKV